MKFGIIAANEDVPQPELLTPGIWGVGDGKEWHSAPSLQVYACTPGGADEVAVTGERSRKERDAEGRRSAIDLEARPGKRSREELGALEERVATARSIVSVAEDARPQELLRPFLEQYARDEIEADELPRRTKAAREQAAAEDATLSAVDKAYAKYMAAVEARGMAEEAEAAAGEELEAALRPLEAKRSSGGEAAASSGVKAEARGDVVR